MINGHGDDLYHYKDIRSNFSSNIYNGFDHRGLFDYLSSRLANVIHYPSPTPRELEEEIATMLGLHPNEVMVTNGATEAIYLVAQAHRRSHSAVLAPTFAEYADACRIHEHRITHVYAMDALSTDQQLLWICNPNNPTGLATDLSELTHSIRKHPHLLHVLDASYASFCPLPMLCAREGVQYPNVLMLHSMTKEYSIPGLRLGYLTGCPALLEPIRAQRMPWSVNKIAMDAGHYLIHHTAEYRLPLEHIMEERARVAERLSALGVIEVGPSDTHLLLCRLRTGKASSLKTFLAREQGILIREASNFAGLNDTFFRIAVQSPEENDQLIQAIATWIAH